MMSHIPLFVIFCVFVFILFFALILDIAVADVDSSNTYGSNQDKRLQNLERENEILRERLLDKELLVEVLKKSNGH